MLVPLQVLLPPVVSCVEDSFYKITSEALLVVLQLVRVMRPQGPSAGGGFDPKPFVKEVRRGLQREQGINKSLWSTDLSGM